MASTSATIVVMPTAKQLRVLHLLARPGCMVEVDTTAPTWNVNRICIAPFLRFQRIAGVTWCSLVEHGWVIPFRTGEPAIDKGLAQMKHQQWVISDAGRTVLAALESGGGGTLDSLNWEKWRGFRKDAGE